ncbi:hypothetical protein AMAG_20523 [Allomyces macrogynus ATCC 38327]|uniref:BAR domain-containing protein n=1 Tax=Allomyces macrogynus (strain ATCC 38327) TaxID=578462 RepID=A0A0L0TD38_ALLM3|nr:hypothetical protein AMAG_20523 [Allomyces macrogynus ATCC 38327]|eukprot:KNE72444.1 hypothetical protein AMAG_20523 [Allomyces macrogynus ATCC 38327]
MRTPDERARMDGRNERSTRPPTGTRSVWTNERLGHAGRTETTVEFKQLERQTDARREAVERILAVSDKYASTLDAKKVTGAGINEELVPQIALGATLLDLGSLMGEKTTYGHDLIIVGEAQDKLGALQATYLTRLRAGFLADLEEYVQESQRYNELKRKLESRRLDYDAKLAKVQKSKKEKPELEEEVRAAQFKYEESMQDVENQMVYLSEFEVHSFSCAVAVLGEQLPYSRAVYGVRGMFPSNYTEPYTPEPAPRPVATSVTGRSTKSTRSMHSAYNAPPPPAPPAAAAGFRSLPPAMARSYSTPVVGSAAAVCSTCGCDEFKANVFKPQSCNNCFHQH